jgi:hypothetical protein
MAQYEASKPVKAIEPEDEHRRPKITYEDNFDKWTNAARPDSVFEKEEE